MKRRFNQVSTHWPRNVEEVQEWLRRVEIFEQVNWDVEVLDYGAVTRLLDDDFVFDWTPVCTSQYNAVAALTGIVHVHPADRGMCPVQAPVNPSTTYTPSSPGTVGRLLSVLPPSNDSERMELEPDDSEPDDLEQDSTE
jgi:hypothetical protein